MANDESVNWRYIARLRLAGLLVVMGLAIEVGTLFAGNPFSFLSFLFVGVGLVFFGVLALVFALVAPQ
jgi:uncharacterized membrane protein